MSPRRRPPPPRRPRRRCPAVSLGFDEQVRRECVRVRSRCRSWRCGEPITGDHSSRYGQSSWNVSAGLRRQSPHYRGLRCPDLRGAGDAPGAMQIDKRGRIDHLAALRSDAPAARPRRTRFKQNGPPAHSSSCRASIRAAHCACRAAGRKPRLRFAYLKMPMLLVKPSASRGGLSKIRRTDHSAERSVKPSGFQRRELHDNLWESNARATVGHSGNRPAETKAGGWRSW